LADSLKNILTKTSGKASGNGGFFMAIMQGLVNQIQKIATIWDYNPKKDVFLRITIRKKTYICGIGR
jgi:hypothetical protein